MVIIILELNKIYNEDCLEGMKKIDDNSIDISITSPPYNLGIRVKSWLQTYKHKNDDNIDKEDYFEWISDVINEMMRVTKNHIFFNIQEVQNNKGIISYIFKNFDKKIKEVFIWAKTNPPSHIVNTQCSNGYEYIFCFSNDNPQSKMFNYCNFDNKKGDYVKNVIIKGVNRTQHAHNYAFPVWLPSFFIHNFTKKNDIVLDPFMGSGTTAVSCKMLNRRFIGFEISKEYCDIADKRINTSVLNQIENTKVRLDSW